MNQEEMLHMLRALGGKVSFALSDPARGLEVRLNPEMPVQAASVIKLFVMAEAFRQREEGQFDFDEPVTVLPEHHLPSCGALTYLHSPLTLPWRDLVTLMIILSDNTATNLLIDRLGADAINATIDRIGCVGTRLRRKLWQAELSRRGIQNTVCAADTERFMKLLTEGRLVSREASEEMLGILFNQRLNGKMPFHLHSHDIRCAHKTGEDSGITHDVGIIMTDHPIYFSFLSEEVDVPAAERVLQDLALAAVE